MKKQHARKATRAAKARVKDLTPRKAAQVKGGGSVSDAFKRIGDGLGSAGRGG